MRSSHAVIHSSTICARVHTVCSSSAYALSSAAVARDSVSDEAPRAADLKSEVRPSLNHEDSRRCDEERTSGT